MKLKDLLLMSALLPAVQFSGFAQCTNCKNDSIVFNYQKFDFKSKPAWAKEGSSITFKIINVNSLALNSNFEATAVNSNHSEGLEVFQKIFEVTKTDSNKTSLMRGLKTEKESIANSIDSFLQLKRKVQGKINLQLATANKYRNQVHQALQLDTFIVTEMRDVNIFSRDQMNAAVNNLSAFRITSGRDIADTFKNAVTGINKIISEMHGSAEQLRIISNVLKKLDPQYGFDAYVDSLTKNLDKLSMLYAGDNLKKMESKITNAQMNYQRIQNADFILGREKVFSLNSDYIEISDTLKDHNNRVVTVIQPVKINSFGGTRIDFSTGIATTFGKLNGWSYFMRRDTSENVTGIDSSKSTHQIGFSPVALAHFTIRCKSFVQPAITIGFNPDFSDFSFSKLLGGISFGVISSNNILRRLVFTGGACVGFAEVLKPKFYNLPEYTALNSLSDSDLTEKALRWGGFFGVSFNFGTINTSSK